MLSGQWPEDGHRTPFSCHLFEKGFHSTKYSYFERIRFFCQKRKCFFAQRIPEMVVKSHLYFVVRQKLFFSSEFQSFAQNFFLHNLDIDSS